MITLAYLGRALVLKPGVYGELFHDRCTVIKKITEEPNYTNGFRRSHTTEPIAMYWYDVDPKDGQQVFCTYSGYGPVILKELRARGLEVTEEDRVANGLGAPDLSRLKGVEWRPGQKEVLARIFAHRGGVIVCPMAFGKTFMAKWIARAYPREKIILTVPSIDIARGMYNDLAPELGDDVGMVGGGKRKPRRVTIAVTHSLEHCDRDASLILVDECHATLTINFIKLFNRFYRAKMFGLSATPEGRGDGCDGFADALFGPQLINVTYQTAVDSGNIVPLKVRLHSVPSGPQLDSKGPSVVLNRRGLWRNSTRNRIIADAVRAVEQEVGPDAQILIMVDVVEHAFILGQLLPEYTVVTGNTDPQRIAKLRHNGLMSPQQVACTPAQRDIYRGQFEKNTLKRAIATMIWKQGVDFRDLSVLVRADGLASPINAGQIPGRLSRLGRETDKTHGLLIDFDDAWDATLQRRAQGRCRIYRKQGWEIKPV